MSDILEYCLSRWLEIGLPLDFVDTFLTLANTLYGPVPPSPSTRTFYFKIECELMGL